MKKMILLSMLTCLVYSCQPPPDKATEVEKPANCQPKNSTKQVESQKNTNWQAIQLEIDESKKNK